MFNYLKKSLLCLLIFVSPYMNLALKAMEEEDKGEKNYIFNKKNLYTVNDQFHSLTEENKIEPKRREPKIYYRNDSCGDFPSCCRICLLDPFEEPPQKGDTVQCLSTWSKSNGKFKYDRDLKMGIHGADFFSCGYKATYESGTHLRVITPHSEFCWEEESYLYRTFCCFGECVTCGFCSMCSACCLYKASGIGYNTTGAKEITEKDISLCNCTWICGWI